MPENLLESIYFLSNAVIGNKFAKFQCFDKERAPTACFFSTQLKLNISELKKSKNWKFYINTVKNVSTASHKLPRFFIRACFDSKKLNTKSLELS